MNRQDFIKKYDHSSIAVTLQLIGTPGAIIKKSEVEKQILDICSDTELQVFDVVESTRLNENRVFTILIVKKGYNQCSDKMAAFCSDYTYADFLKDYSDLKELELEEKYQNNLRLIKEASRICDIQKIGYEEITKDEDFKTSSLYSEGFIQGYSSNTFSFWWKPSGERLLIIFNLGTFIIK